MKQLCVWIAREDYGYDLYDGAKKPIYNGKHFSSPGRYVVAEFCKEEFERVTGFKLKPGEVKRVRISVEEVTQAQKPKQ